MVTGLAGIFKGRRLKNRHADRALNPRVRLACVNEFGFHLIFICRHRSQTRPSSSTSSRAMTDSGRVLSQLNTLYFYRLKGPDQSAFVDG